MAISSGYFSLTLKVMAPAFVAVGLLHLVFGAGSEVMLGANISSDVLNDPVVDSQNRFYGIAFSLYGFLMYLCATDIKRYEWVLKITLWVFFAAGLARIVSIQMVGLPSSLVLLLLASELLLPPVLLFWLHRELQRLDG